MSSKPGNCAAAGRASSVTVSPILVSPTFLMVAAKNPTSPAISSPISTGLGISTPMDSISKLFPFDISRIRWPLRMEPCITRTSTMTPR